MRHMDLVREYACHPRNVSTAPTDGRAPRWFWVSAENNRVTVSSGRTPYANSSIRGQRTLQEREMETMLALYRRRKRGEPVSAEASRATQNQVYWYGIFADLKL